MENKISQSTESLYRAILSIETVDEAARFFRDLLTTNEINSITERWEIVRLLDQGLPYRDIAKKLKTSTTTVARVASWLRTGTGGYRIVLNKQEQSHHTSSSSRKKWR